MRLAPALADSSGKLREGRLPSYWPYLGFGVALLAACTEEPEYNFLSWTIEGAPAVHLGQQSLMTAVPNPVITEAGPFHWTLTSSQGEELLRLQTTTATALIDFQREGHLALALVVDGTPGLTQTATKAITVFNIAPSPTLVGPSSGPRNHVWIYRVETPPDPDGDAVTYQWTVGGSANASIGSPTSTERFLFTPRLSGSLTLRLTVTDRFGKTTTVERELQVREINNRPIANAGSDLLVGVGESLQLDGRESVDADGDELAFDWMVEGTAAELSEPQTSRPILRGKFPGQVRVHLRVSDPFERGQDDTIEVRVREAIAPQSTCRAPPQLDLRLRRVLPANAIAPVCGPWVYVGTSSPPMIQLMNIEDGTVAEAWDLGSAPDRMLLDAEAGLLWLTSDAPERAVRLELQTGLANRLEVGAPSVALARLDSGGLVSLGLYADRRWLEAIWSDRRIATVQLPRLDFFAVAFDLPSNSGILAATDGTLASFSLDGSLDPLVSTWAMPPPDGLRCSGMDFDDVRRRILLTCADSEGAVRLSVFDLDTQGLLAAAEVDAGANLALFAPWDGSILLPDLLGVSKRATVDQPASRFFTLPADCQVTTPPRLLATTRQPDGAWFTADCTVQGRTTFFEPRN